MAELSPIELASASRREQAALRVVAKCLASTSLEVLAAAIGKDDSTASRIRSEEARVSMSDAVRLLHAAGLKVVTADKVCVDRDTFQAMSTIATKAMANPETARRLVWDDET